MTEDSHLEDLLSLWQQRLCKGEDIPAAVLCQNCPELIAPLQKRIETLRRLNLLAAPPEATTVRPLFSESLTNTQGAAPPAIPGYEILEVLGYGGMGVVYKALQVRASRVVALKMLQSGVHASPQDLARFRIEAESIARLNHPNIVSIHDVGDHEGLPYFSLEYCSGGSLARALNGTPLPAAEAAELVEVLAQALHVAHAANVLHRDLKPGNVLLTGPQEGEGCRRRIQGTPKIADFGLARKFDDPGMTPTGAVLGTPSYMAPEQARGETARAGCEADVYSLGAILYECLTGRPPFRAATAADTMLQVLTEDPVSPRRLDPRLPRDLETICLKCLQKEPQRRYQTALELALDLARFRAGEPIVARPQGWLGRAWRWSRRKPMVAGLLLGLLVVILGSLAGLTGLYLQAEQRHREAIEAGRIADEQAHQRLEAERLAGERAAEAQRVKAVEGELRDTFKTLLSSLKSVDPLQLQEVVPIQATDVGLQRMLSPFLDRASEKLLTGTVVEAGSTAELMNALGSLNRGLGRYAEAARLLERAVTLRREQQPVDPAALADALHELGWLNHDLGRYDEAESLYQESLVFRQKVCQANDPTLEPTRFNLAWVQAMMGDYLAAEQNFLELLAIRRARSGEKARDVGVISVALAALYLEQNDPVRALPHVGKGLKILNELEGMKGFSDAITAFQAGTVALLGGGDLGFAESELHRSSELIARNLGDGHAYMALVLYQRAMAQERKGDRAGAEASYRRCLDIVRQTVTFGHPKAPVAASRIASFFLKQGRAKEADSLIAEVLEAQKQRFGPPSPLVADAFVELADVLGRESDDSKAKVLEEALGLYRAKGGVKHRLLAQCLNSLGLHRLRRHQPHQAATFFEEALLQTKRQYGERHQNTANVRVHLARAYLAQGKPNESEQLLNHALEVLEPQGFRPLLKVLGPASLGPLTRPPGLVDARIAQGELYRATGRVDLAESAARKRRAEAGTLPGPLYDVACDYALLVPLVPEGPRRERLAAEAVSLLDEAFRHGFTNLRLLRTDSDLDPLRFRPDFRTLYDRLTRERLPPPTLKGDRHLFYGALFHKSPPQQGTHS